ncbi:MAG TPA: hypothetical protein PLM89_03310, partial [Anaerolineales bacterium]|nr:hypothetical protein [Anaerolineales bacterium]
EIASRDVFHNVKIVIEFFKFKNTLIKFSFPAPVLSSSDSNKKLPFDLKGSSQNSTRQGDQDSLASGTIPLNFISIAIV